MTHYGTSAIKDKPKTDNDWLAVGAKVGQLVNRWSSRTDLIAYVSERAGERAGAPAAFNPKSAEIEVNTVVAFGYASPEEVADLTERSQQFEFPKATGAIYHEAMHARFSTWDLEKAAQELQAGALRALHLLEESRIEHLGVVLDSNNRVFLRACALEIVLADMKEEEVLGMTSTRQAAQALALTSARVDAGVLEQADVQLIVEQIRTVISQEKLDDFRRIWLEFQTLQATDIARMYELAIKWSDLVEQTAEENGEAEESAESEKQASKFAEEMMEAFESATRVSNVRVMSAVEDQQKTEEYAEQAEAQNQKNSEKQEHKRTAHEVFGTGSHSSGDATNSRLIETRPPTSEERVSAVKISKALEKAQYQDRVQTLQSSETPPGRLRTRALIQGQALKDKNIVGNVEPFKRTLRKHVDDPNLTIGVVVDISGSMRSAMQPMASAAWILSEATRRVSGKVGMAYYGNSVFATLKPGQHLPDVKVYSASDSTEEFDTAFKAVDGALNLLDGAGARLLVIVSDGAYRPSQKTAVRKWIRLCKKAGVGVLWIGAGSHADSAKQYCSPQEGAVYTRMGDSATSVADEIGRAAAEALTKAGATR